jgi:hypothetical protein
MQQHRKARIRFDSPKSDDLVAAHARQELILFRLVVVGAGHFFTS